MSRVIITGAASMLGIALINECLLNNDEVVAVVRPGSQKNLNVPKNSRVILVEQDLSIIDGLALKLNGNYEVFYHLGWADTDKQGRNDFIKQEKNVRYTLKAVELANKVGCEVFMGAGSQAEYGRYDRPILEDFETRPETDYGKAKLEAGKSSAKLCSILKIKHIWTRIFSVYGPYDNANTMISYCVNMLLSKEKPLFTKCEQMWDYLYCADAAKAMVLAAKNGKDGFVYNVGSGKARLFSEYVYAIRDEIDHNLPVGIGEREYAKGQVMYLCADISRISRDTGFLPQVKFDDGIKYTIKWARENTK